MKILSYFAFALAGICLVFTLIAHLFFEGRFIFNWMTYIRGIFIFLLTAIVFALYHLAEIKSK